MVPRQRKIFVLCGPPYAAAHAWCKFQPEPCLSLLRCGSPAWVCCSIDQNIAAHRALVLVQIMFHVSRPWLRWVYVAVKGGDSAGFGVVGREETNSLIYSSFLASRRSAIGMHSVFLLRYRGRCARDTGHLLLRQCALFSWLGREASHVRNILQKSPLDFVTLALTWNPDFYGHGKLVPGAGLLGPWEFSKLGNSKGDSISMILVEIWGSGGIFGLV